MIVSKGMALPRMLLMPVARLRRTVKQVRGEKQRTERAPGFLAQFERLLAHQADLAFRNMDR